MAAVHRATWVASVRMSKSKSKGKRESRSKTKTRPWPKRNLWTISRWLKTLTWTTCSRFR